VSRAKAWDPPLCTTEGPLCGDRLLHNQGIFDTAFPPARLQTVHEGKGANSALAWRLRASVRFCLAPAAQQHVEAESEAALGAETETSITAL